MVFRELALGCPRCSGRELTTRLIDGIRRHQCVRCHGSFVDRDAIAALAVQRKVPLLRLLDEGFETTGRFCPYCREEMLELWVDRQGLEREIDKKARVVEPIRVVIDSCAAHGIWLESGELDRVLALLAWKPPLGLLALRGLKVEPK